MGRFWIKNIFSITRLKRHYPLHLLKAGTVKRTDTKRRSRKYSLIFTQIQQELIKQNRAERKTYKNYLGKKTLMLHSRWWYLTPNSDWQVTSL